MAVTIGNTTIATSSAGGGVPGSFTVSHDNDGDGLLIFVTIFDTITDADEIGITATYDDVDMDDLGQVATPFSETIPHTAALYLESAASGVNDIDVSLTFTGLQQARSAYVARSVYAISVSGNGSAGSTIGANTSSSDVSTLNGAIVVDAVDSLIIGQVTAQGGDTDPFTVGSGYTKLGSDFQTATHPTSDFAGMVQHKTSTATGSQNFDASWSSSDQASIIAVEIQETAAGTTINPGTASRTRSLFAPAISKTIDAGQASRSHQIFSPDLSKTISPGLSSRTKQIFSPDLSKTITPGLISRSRSLFAPDISKSVTASLASRTQALFNPSISKSLTASTVSRSRSVFSPSISGGAVTAVKKVLVSSSGGIYRTASGGLLTPSVRATPILHQFTLTNTESATTSTGLFRVGLAFEKGDVASGRILQAEIGGTELSRSARMLNRNYWSDDSLRSCILVGDAGTFAASETKTIDVKAVIGSQGTSSLTPETYIDSQDDLTVEITNHTGSSNNTNVGDLTFSLQTAMDTSTRVEITDDTDMCVRFWCWEQVGNDEHLICLNYVDIWLDTNGSTVLAVEWTPVLSQHSYVDDPYGTAQDKQIRNYDAAIKDGTTTLESHTSLYHCYYCRWAALRTDDDDQHARRLWLNKASTAMPTLNLKYSAASKRKMAKTGYLPPLTTNSSHITVPRVYSQTDHTPLGETPTSSTGNAHNHRKAINGTGAYNGRGAISDMDAQCLMLQGADDWRTARVSAQAGLSVHFHIRDHRTASGGFANGDVSAGLIPAKVDLLGAQSYTGLASELNASIDGGSNNDLADDAPVSGSVDRGAFTAWDPAHHVSYSYFMAFVEGEAYLQDAVLSAAHWPMHDVPHEVAAALDSNLLFGANHATRASTQSIPSTTYGTNYLVWSQEREMAWTQYAVLRAYQLMRDGDRHKSYFENLLKNASDFIEDSISYFPSSQTSKGSTIHTQGGVGSPWMNNFQVLAAFDTVPIADDEGWTGFKTWAEQAAKLLANTYEHDPYASLSYRHLYTLDGATKLVYAPVGETLILRSGDVTSDVFTITNPLSGLEWKDDDICYMSEDSDQNVTVNPPSPLAINTKYYVVNATSSPNTFQLSATQGGSAITGITDQATVWVGIKAQDATDVSPIGTSGADLGADDDFGQIAYAAAELAALRGSTNFSASLTSDIRTFYAPRVADWGTETSDSLKYFAWNYDGNF